MLKPYVSCNVYFLMSWDRLLKLLELSFLSYSLEIITAPIVIRSLYELNEIQFAHGLALIKYSMTHGCVISLENIPMSLIYIALSIFLLSFSALFLSPFVGIILGYQCWETAGIWNISHIWGKMDPYLLPCCSSLC